MIASGFGAAGMPEMVTLAPDFDFPNSVHASVTPPVNDRAETPNHKIDVSPNSGGVDRNLVTLFIQTHARIRLHAVSELSENPGWSHSTRFLFFKCRWAYPPSNSDRVETRNHKIDLSPSSDGFDRKAGHFIYPNPR